MPELTIKDSKPKGGRPEFVPTEEQRLRVMIWTAGGITQKHIARIINLSEPTLRKHFKKELEDGLVEANCMVMHAVFVNALTPGGKSDRALWMKCRGGWSDKVQVVSPPQEEPISPIVPGQEQPQTWANLLTPGEKRTH